jgi:hypothetical protein
MMIKEGARIEGQKENQVTTNASLKGDNHEATKNDISETETAMEITMGKA